MLDTFNVRWWLHDGYMMIAWWLNGGYMMGRMVTSRFDDGYMIDGYLMAAWWIQGGHMMVT
jgi:hypothetical protein